MADGPDTFSTCGCANLFGDLSNQGEEIMDFLETWWIIERNLFFRILRVSRGANSRFPSSRIHNIPLHYPLTQSTHRLHTSQLPHKKLPQKWGGVRADRLLRATGSRMSLRYCDSSKLIPPRTSNEFPHPSALHPSADGLLPMATACMAARLTLLICGGDACARWPSPRRMASRATRCLRSVR